MRIIVLSDSHKDFGVVNSIVHKHYQDAQVFIHLGDGIREFEDVEALYDDREFYSVRGNCDFFSQKSATDILTLGDVRIFICHGHTLGVKYSLGELLVEAACNQCKIALFGHTHVPLVKYDQGIYLMNPGSCAQPRNGKISYGLIDLVDGEAVCNIVELQ